MAFVSNMPDEEENKTNQPNGGQGPISPTGTGGGVHLAPSSAVASGGGGSPTAGNPASAGGSFASLDKYLTANQGQAAPLAGKLTPGIDKQYNDLDTANNATIADINSQVTSAPGYTPNNPDVIAQEAANPVSFSSDAGNVKNFQNLLTNSYGGPASAESTTNYSDQQNAINSAIATGKQNTTTEAGRKNLLAQNEATPTAGVTALNSAILSKDPNALNSIESAYKPFDNLLTNLGTGAAGVNATIGQEKSDAAASAKAANDAISGQIGAFNTDVTGRTAAAQKAATDQANLFKTDLAAGTPSAADLQSLGITSDQWNSLSAAQKAAATSSNVLSNQGQFGAASGTANVDLSNFLSSTDPNTALNTANIANKGDYDKAQAFQTLLNGLNLGTPSTVINSSTVGQAGTAPTNLNSFDYQTALNTAQQAKTDEVAAAQAYVDALQGGADETHAQLAAQKAAKESRATQLTSMTLPIIPITAGAGAGVAQAGKSYIDYLKSSDPKQIAANVASFGMAPVVQSVGKGVVAAVNTVANMFCFHPDTLITMADGSLLPICKVDIGDMTWGGKVLATTRAIGQDFYWYNGVIITGKHAVQEDGVWVRVEKSKYGKQFKYLTEVVCNLVTETHRIYANGITFADQYETDLYESLDMDESLKELNKNANHAQ